jgi:hypothetical protein
MFENQLSLQSSSIASQSVRPSWNHCLEKVMRESDPQRLLPLVHAVEAALFLRWQEMTDESAQSYERAAMQAACDDLWAIKIHKLGWPMLPGRKTE